MHKLDPNKSAEEIVNILAKYNVPIYAIQTVFDSVKGLIEEQSVQPRDAKDQVSPLQKLYPLD